MEQELQEEDDLRSRCPRTPGIPTKRTGDYSEEMLRYDAGILISGAGFGSLLMSMYGVRRWK